MKSFEKKENKIFDRLFKLAVLSGAEAAVRAHLKIVPSVNVFDTSGATPLMLAAAKGHLGICQLLIEKGADLQLKDSKGRNAKMHAKEGQHWQIVSLLKENSPSSISSKVQLCDKSTPAYTENNSSHLINKDERKKYDNSIDSQLVLETLVNSGINSNICSPVNPIFKAKKHILNDDESKDDCVQQLEIIKENVEQEDLSGWVILDETPPPAEDYSSKNSAEEVQNKISNHTPIDTSEDWSEVLIELPEIEDSDLGLFRNKFIYEGIKKLFYFAMGTGIITDKLLQSYISEVFEAQLLREALTFKGAKQYQCNKMARNDAVLQQFNEKLSHKVFHISRILEDIGISIVSHPLDVLQVSDTELSIEDEQTVNEAMELLDNTLFSRDDPVTHYFASLP